MVDAVRGLACLSVLLHHSYLYWYWRVRLPGVDRLNRIGSVGYLGVHQFLVLSGFVLFLPVVRRHGVRRANVELRTFIARRARRILPPYYIALLLFGVPSLIPSPIQPYFSSLADVRGTVEHLLMVFNLDPSRMVMFNGAFWSLALEWQLYLLFPLLLWGCRRAGLPATVGATLGVSVAWQVLIAPHAPGIQGVPRPQQDWCVMAAWYYAVPGRCFEFAMGMAAAALVARPRPRQTAVAAGIIAVLGPLGVWLSDRHGQFGPARDQVWGVVFAATLVVATAAPLWLADLRPVRVTAWAGGISYSIYLLHEPLLMWSEPCLTALCVPRAWRLLAFLLVGLPALVGLGYLFHRVAERPFMSVRRPPLAPDAAAEPAELRLAVAAADRRLTGYRSAKYRRYRPSAISGK